MATTSQEIKKQIIAEYKNAEKELQNMILTCCENAWSIPTDEIKKQILVGHGWTLEEIERDIQNCCNDIPDITPERNIEIALNTLLTRSFYIFAAEDLYMEDCEDLVWEVMYEFGN